MQLLAFGNVYDEANDRLQDDFVRLTQNPPSEFEVLEANAGMGADWPGALWTNAQGIAVALAIFSAPATIEQNWPTWKRLYDQATALMLEFHGEFRIDRDTAQVIAIEHAVVKLGMRADSLTIHMAIRHFRQYGNFYQDLLADERIDMSWVTLAEQGRVEVSPNVIKSTEEAARQAICRYVFGIGDTHSCTTLVVEQDGRVTFSADL
jgi:hypothetical protein